MNVRKRICIAFTTIAVIAGLPLVGQQDQAEKYARRPSVPGVHGLVTSGHPLASMAVLSPHLAAAGFCLPRSTFPVGWSSTSPWKVVDGMSSS